MHNNFSAGCDKYQLWHHFSCVGFPEGVNLVITGQWFCKVLFKKNEMWFLPYIM